MTIFLDGNTHEPEFTLRRKNTATGELELATGVTGLKVRLTATKEGAAIDASLDVTISERASSPGKYFGTIPGADIHTYLEAYLGRKVWEVLYDSADQVQGAHRQPVQRREI
jgi:hypothetical protein